MPSTEIVCVDQGTPIALPDLPFAVEVENELRSHRGEHALWQKDFDRLTGQIYHLGNPDLRDPTQSRAYFAYDLLSERSRRPGSGLLEFDAAHRGGIARLMTLLLTASRRRQLVFTTDWQFGPTRSTRGGFGTTCVPADAMMRSTLSRTSSAAKSGSRRVSGEWRGEEAHGEDSDECDAPDHHAALRTPSTPRTPRLRTAPGEELFAPNTGTWTTFPPLRTRAVWA